jgi:hypothetical protein
MDVAALNAFGELADSFRLVAGGFVGRNELEVWHNEAPKEGGRENGTEQIYGKKSFFSFISFYLIAPQRATITIWHGFCFSSKAWFMLCVIASLSTAQK